MESFLGFHLFFSKIVYIFAPVLKFCFMEDLIEALTILKKYISPDDEYGREFPTTCEHDMLFVNCVSPDVVSDEDKSRLKELGFVPYDNFAFVSYRFGDN